MSPFAISMNALKVSCASFLTSNVEVCVPLSKTLSCFSVLWTPEEFTPSAVLPQSCNAIRCSLSSGLFLCSSQFRSATPQPRRAKALMTAVPRLPPRFPPSPGPIGLAMAERIVCASPDISCERGLCKLHHLSMPVRRDPMGCGSTQLTHHPLQGYVSSTWSTTQSSHPLLSPSPYLTSCNPHLHLSHKGFWRAR